MTMCCFMHPSPAVTGKRSGGRKPVLRKNSTRARIGTEVLSICTLCLRGSCVCLKRMTVNKH